MLFIEIDHILEIWGNKAIESIEQISVIWGSFLSQIMDSVESFEAIDYFYIIPIILYLPTIFSLKYYIDNIASKETQTNLKTFSDRYCKYWNLFLGIFSTFGAFYTIKHVILYGYNCSFVKNPTTLIWIQLFCHSKIPEFMDTVFIVFKRRPLILLQYWHHFATALLAFFGKDIMTTNIIIASGMNYFVHSIMYTYFALVSFGYKKLIRYGFLVTILQFAQMAIAVYFIMTETMVSCVDPGIEIGILYYYGFFMYFSYLVLFGKLLIEKICSKSKTD